MPEFRPMAWLSEPDPHRGIRFANDARSWDLITYRQLAAQVAAAVGAFREAGIGRGCRVGLIYPTGPDFVTALLALWGLGATPCPLAPRGGQLRGAEYADHVAALADAAGMQAIAADANIVAAMTAVFERLTVPVLTDLRGTAMTADLAGPDDVALIQFSSGSTARPKGTVITAEGLSAHTAAIAEWLQMSPATPFASWVPLHHDMGLVGCLLTPMALGADVWLMRPEQFLRDPLRWLLCFCQGNAVLSGATSSGLRYAVQHVDPAALVGLDFSRWQALVVGAERVRPDDIRCFGDLLAPFGFRDSAIVPAYGMAEATLAVTGDSLASEPKTMLIDADQLALDRPVSPPCAGGAALEVTSCGRPLVGTVVRVLSSDGAELPPRHLGEIEVRSTTMAAGYAERGLVPARRFQGVMCTGDAGFVADGELYVIGRVGDSLNIRGQRVFAEDMEQVLRHHVPELGEPVVLLGSRGDQDVAAVLIDRGDAEHAARMARALAPYLPGAAIEIWRAPRRAISRTTSGKARRRHLWQVLEEGSVGGQQLWPPEGAPRILSAPAAGQAS